MALLLAAVLLPTGLHGQATLLEDPLDPVYLDLDKLRGFGLFDDQIVGQRPYSRREIARLVAEARGRLGEGGHPVADGILDRLEARYGELTSEEDQDRPSRVPTVDEVRVSAVVADSEWRPVPETRGGIDADINPLLQGRQGRRLADGENLLGELTLAWRPADVLALSVTPRGQRSWSDAPAFEVEDVFLQTLQANLLLGNVRLSAGRQHLAWGQGLEGGLFVSSNARGLDLVQIGNDHPFLLPGFLRHLGPTSASLFVARLEDDRDVPHAFLVGYRGSFRPTSRLEVGFTVMTQSGGEGGPEASFGERVADHVIFLEPFVDAEISNRLAGLDARVLLSKRRGAEFYFEYLVEDPPQDIGGVDLWLWENVGLVTGLWLPRLTGSGSLDLRLEGRHAGLILYRHGQFPSGYTVDRQVIGDPLGPDGNGAYLTLGGVLDPSSRLELHLAVERYSADRFRSVNPPDGNQRREVVEEFPKEDRARGLLSFALQPRGRPLHVRFEAGLEWLNDFDFESVDSRTNFLLGVAGRWRP